MHENSHSIATSLKRVLICCTLLLTAHQAMAGYSDNEHSKAAILGRIGPIGQVKTASAAASDTAAGGAATAARSGSKVYGTYCIACHGTGIAGAPKKGDAAAWAPRKKQGIATLVKHALHGLNAMPPKGTCMDCSETEIHNAVEFMIK